MLKSPYRHCPAPVMGRFSDSRHTYPAVTNTAYRFRLSARLRSPMFILARIMPMHLRIRLPAICACTPNTCSIRDRILARLRFPCCSCSLSFRPLYPLRCFSRRASSSARNISQFTALLSFCNGSPTLSRFSKRFCQSSFVPLWVLVFD